MTIGKNDQGRIPFKRKVIPVSSIGAAPGDGPTFNEKHINLLAAIVARNGLTYPITVNADGCLLSGGHWLAAVRQLGWQTVEVLVVG
jgi:ParB-like chromosome segregation protein Spo0J